MPVTLVWDNETHTTIRFEFVNPITWEEVNTAHAELIKTIQATPHRVDLILNIAAKLPKGNPIPHMKAQFASLFALSNYGIGVAVIPKRESAVAKTFFNVVMSVYKFARSQSHTVVHTLEDARTLIAQRRAELLSTE